MKSQRRVKKYRINKRSDNDFSDDNRIYYSESIEQPKSVPVYRGTISGYPYSTPYNDNTSPNYYYREPNISPRISSPKQEEESDDERDAAEEYEERIPLKENVDIPENTSKEKSSVNSVEEKKTHNYPKLVSQFSHMVSHDGRGYHTSYFIPNIDKTINEHKNGNLDSKDFWRPDIDQRVAKNSAKNEFYSQKARPDPKPEPRHEPRPVRVPVVRPVSVPIQPIPVGPVPIAPVVVNPQSIRYSPLVLTNAYNAHSYAGSEQPMIRSPSPLFVNPYPNHFYNDMYVTRKPVHRNVSYRSNSYTNSVRDSSQRPERQYRRQPVFSGEQQSFRRPSNHSGVPPVHWTRVVSELNDQKKIISDDYRHKSRDVRPKHYQRSGGDVKYYRVGASLNMQ